MEKSTTTIPQYVNNDETNNIDTQKAKDSIDTIAFYLFESIKRKSNQQQRKGA